MTLIKTHALYMMDRGVHRFAPVLFPDPALAPERGVLCGFKR